MSHYSCKKCGRRYDDCTCDIDPSVPVLTKRNLEENRVSKISLKKKVEVQTGGGSRKGSKPSWTINDEKEFSRLAEKRREHESRFDPLNKFLNSFPNYIFDPDGKTSFPDLVKNRQSLLIIIDERLDELINILTSIRGD